MDSTAPYHHGNLRAELVEQGLDLLEAGEHADLSLRELARRVGVSANAVYRHFANKDALLAAMAAEGFRRFSLAQAEAVTHHAAEVDGFRHAGRAYVDFARAHPALFRLMFGKLPANRDTAELKEAAEASFEGLKTGIAHLSGLPVDDPLVTIRATTAWSLVHGLSHLLLDGRLDHLGPDTGALIDQVIGHVATL